MGSFSKKINVFKFFRTSKRKITLALKCICTANYKFIDSPILNDNFIEAVYSPQRITKVIMFDTVSIYDNHQSISFRLYINYTECRVRMGLMLGLQRLRTVTVFIGSCEHTRAHAHTHTHTLLPFIFLSSSFTCIFKPPVFILFTTILVPPAFFINNKLFEWQIRVTNIMIEPLFCLSRDVWVGPSGRGG